MTKLALFDLLFCKKDESCDQDAKLFTIYFLLLCANIGLVWLLPYFPTQDGPSHIYNLVILRDLMNGGKDWGNFFTYDLKPVPNLGFHLIAYPLLNFFPPFVVEKIFVSIFILLLALSVPFYLRTFEKPALPLSFFVFPVVFNFNLMMGFYSFVIAVPFMLCAISICWRIRNKPYLVRFLIFNAAGLAIFYIHLIPFCLFLLAVFLMVIITSKTVKDFLKNTTYLALALFPVLCVFLSYLVAGLKTGPGNSSHLYSLGYFSELIAELPMFSMDTFSRWQIVPWVIFFVIYFQFVRCTVLTRLGSDKFNKTEKFILILTGCVVTLYLTLPFNFGSGSYFNQRLPWIVLLMSLPLLDIPKLGLFGRFKTQILVGAAVVILLFNAAILSQKSSQIGTYLSGLPFKMPKGAYVMAYKPDGPGWSRIDILLHAVSYYCLFYKCIDIGNYEADYNIFPVHYKKTSISFPPESKISFSPRTIDFTKYPLIEYVYCWDIKDKDMENLNAFFNNICQKDCISIWHRKRL